MYSVLVVTHSYPSKLAPFRAKFIQDQVLLFNNSDQYNVKVLHLTPKTIPFTARFKEFYNGYNDYGELIDSKTYLSFPRRYFPGFIQKNITSAILSYLAKKQVNIIHLHWLFPAGMTIKELRKQGYYVILTIHGSDWYKSIIKPDLRKLVLESLRHANQILFSGPKLRDDVLSVIPDIEKQSSLIYNFIDSDFYELPSKKKKAEKKELLGFDRSKKHILTVASLRKEKGIDTLIEAVKNISSTDIQFHIVGLVENTTYANFILSMIRRFGLEKIIILHGQKSPQELLDYYFASDLYVLPSRNEGFNLSILEATSTGLPVLCTDVGGNSVVLDNKMGFVIPPEKAKKLAEKLTYMIQNLGSFNPTYISSKTKSKYTEKPMKERLLKIYSKFNSL